VRSVIKEKSKEGVLLPDSAREAPNEGEVIAVGDGKILENGERIPLEIKVGEIIIFSCYAGVEINLPEEENKNVSYFVLKEQEILAREEK